MGWVKKNAISGQGLSAVRKLSVLGVVGLAVAAAKPANAALTLTLSEPGYGSATGTVSGSTDTYTMSFGTYIANFVIGYSNSATPSNLAQLQIQSLDIMQTNATAGALTIVFSDTGFTFPGVVGTNLLMTSTLGGTLTTPAAGDTVSFQSSATPSGGSTVSTPKQTFTMTTPVGSTAPLLVPATTANFTQTGLFTLSDTIVASLSGAGETANLSGSTTVSPAPVPEPVGMSMLAIGGLVLGRRRRAR